MLPKSQSQSTAQNFLDIYDITNNFTILKDGTVSIVLSVGAMNFGLLAEAEQDAVIYTYAALLNSLNYPIQIIIQSQTKDVTDYLNLLKQQEESASTDLKRERIARYRQFVSDVIKERNVLDKKFFVTVPASPTELGLITADSFVPGKNSFNIADFEKSVILEKAEAVLSPKRDHLISQFARIGLFSRQLNTQEIIRIFYTSYNPEASEGQELTDTNQYTTPLVKANFINQTGELFSSQKPMQQDPQQNQNTQQPTQPSAGQQGSGPMEEISNIETDPAQQDSIAQAAIETSVDPVNQLAVAQEQTAQQIPETQTISEPADVATAQSQDTLIQPETHLPPNTTGEFTNTPEPTPIQPAIQPTQVPPTMNFSENLDDFEVKMQGTTVNPTTTQTTPEINTRPPANPEIQLATEPQPAVEMDQVIVAQSPQQTPVNPSIASIEQPNAIEEDLQKTINQALQEAGETNIVPTQENKQPVIEPTPTVQTAQNNEPIFVEPTIQTISPPPMSENTNQQSVTSTPESTTSSELATPAETVVQPAVSPMMAEEELLGQQNNTKQAEADSLPPIAEI